MKALTYHGPHHVSVDTMPDPALEAADDIILRVTATAICGSDLHLYRGKIPVRTMVIFSAMNLWGSGGSRFRGHRVRKGDRVVIPFVIACGDCFFVACSSMPPAKAPIAAVARRSIEKAFRHRRRCLAIAICTAGSRAAAEYVRVPKANTGPFKVPDTLPDEKVLFLSDILPTARQAVKNAEVKPGSSVVFWRRPGRPVLRLLRRSMAQNRYLSSIITITDSISRNNAMARSR